MTDEAISLKKKKLRKKYLEIRSSMSAAEVKENSNMIHRHLFALEQFLLAKAVHTYVSMSQRNEVDTLNVIQYLHDSGKEVQVPRMEANSTLSHYVLHSLNDLQENEWGVMEPMQGEVAEISQTDIVIVPMVSGDKQKNRLGYGKGFYDRFLKQIDAVKIGLLFNLQLYQGALPVNRYDVPLDILITESGLIL